MAIPNFQTIMLPFMQLLSGQQASFTNRGAWAKRLGGQAGGYGTTRGLP